MRSEYDAHLSLYPGRPKHELRCDWAMAQAVDTAIEQLKDGAIHSVIAASLRDRGVPTIVIHRVLAGLAREVRNNPATNASIRSKS